MTLRYDACLIIGAQIMSLVEYLCWRFGFIKLMLANVLGRSQEGVKAKADIAVKLKNTKL